MMTGTACFLMRGKAASAYRVYPTFDWALESPVAEIMVYSYAAFMIFSGIFSILSYTKGKVKSKLMQVCVVINSIYAVGAIAIIGMNIVTRIGG